MGAVAIVTGGNRGIGLGITKALLASGFAVQIFATRPQPDDLLTELAELGEVGYTQGDITQAEAHQRLLDDVVERWGRVDVLVNNAGVAPSQREDVLTASEESYDRVMAINLKGPYFLTQRVARQMLAQADPEPSPAQSEHPELGLRGVVVNVSSCSATVVSIDRGEYCISKAGVSMATQVWAARLAGEGIGVYEVRPGIIATDMTSGVTAKYDALIDGGLTPIKRWGQPSDIGSVVSALASGAMPYSTGEVINVDGGMHIARL